MFYKNRFFSLVLITASILCITCDKKPFNYRNKYQGNWSFHYNSFACCFGPPNPSISETNDYAGKIYYNRNNAKDEIQINFAHNQDQTFTIDKNGILGGCGVKGKISGTSISFTRDFNQSCTGAMGSGSSYTVVGTQN